MESANLISKPMTNTEALKILNLEGKDLTPENIIKVLKTKIKIEIRKIDFFFLKRHICYFLGKMIP